MARNPFQVWGQATIRINGEMIQHGGKVKFSPGGTAREAVTADNQAGYWTGSPTESRLEFEPLVTTTVSLARMNAWDDETVMIEFDTGQTYVMNHARTVEPTTASEGKAPISMAGPAAEEIV